MLLFSSPTGKHPSQLSFVLGYKFQGLLLSCLNTVLGMLARFMQLGAAGVPWGQEL